MKQTPWFERKFDRIADNGLLPNILERLAGTPVRILEILEGTEPHVLEIKPGIKWSIKEEIGHLTDLEPLWSGRVDDLINKRAELHPADLTNKKTSTAGHHDKPIKQLLNEFTAEREQLLIKLWDLDPTIIEHEALHPRLKTPMRLIDLLYFVAEHDDHHLVKIRSMVNG